MTARETDARGFAAMLWGLASADARESAGEDCGEAIPHLSPCKPVSAPAASRDGAKPKK